MASLCSSWRWSILSVLTCSSVVRRAFVSCFLSRWQMPRGAGMSSLASAK